MVRENRFLIWKIKVIYGKTDYILFIPEDKYEKLPWKTSGAEMAYTNIASSAALYYPIGDIFTPDEGRIVEVVKNFTREEQDELLKKIGVNLLNDHLFSHIRNNPDFRFWSLGLLLILDD